MRSKNFTKYFVIFLFVWLVLLPPIFSQAQNRLVNPLTTDSFAELIADIAKWIFIFVVPIAVVMILIGAIMMMTSGGNPQRITTAKNIIIWTLIGFAVALLATGLIRFVATALGVE